MDYKFTEIDLPSGAKLKIQAAPFADSKALYSALMEEAKGVEISKQLNVENLVKSLLLTVGCSPKIDRALWKCFEKCLYNDLKIDAQTFEPLEARQDFVIVCMEVGKENVTPFVSGLYVVWNQIISIIESTRK